jgi:hypothetical protein
MGVEDIDVTRAGKKILSMAGVEIRRSPST